MRILSFLPARVRAVAPKLFLLAPLCGYAIGGLPQTARAQIDIRITPSESAFGIAAPELCRGAAGGRGELGEQGAEFAATISKLIAADLGATGLYRSSGPDEFDGPLGSCEQPNGGVFPADLPTRRINDLVTGRISAATDAEDVFIVDLYLYDVAKSQDVLKRRYEGTAGSIPSFAHSFANEILELLSGTRGSFGGQIVYVSDSDQGKASRELFAMVLGTKSRRQVTNNGGTNSLPAWSPDGRSVLFASSTNNNQADLYLVPATGGKPTQVTFLPGLKVGGSFAANGKEFIAATAVSGRQNLARFNLRGRLLTRLTETQGDDTDPAVSPDDQRIAFISTRGGAAQLYTMLTEGGEARLVESTKGKTCARPAWSPDGTAIALSCKDPKGLSQLFLTQPKGTELTQLTFQNDNLEPSWSPDGRMIVFATRANAQAPADIAVFSLKSLKTTLVAASPEDDRFPVWSPSKQEPSGEEF